MDYYNYAYLDPRAPLIDAEFLHQPFYIGRGRGTRAFDHLKESAKLPEAVSKDLMKRKRLNMLKINKIRSIQKSGLQPIIVKFYENLTLQESKEFERIEIKKWGRIWNGSGCLTNLTAGGDDRHVCNAGPFNPFYGKTHTRETKQLISTVHKGKILTEEHKKKISDSSQGHKKTHQTKERMRAQMKARATNPDDPSMKAMRVARSKTWTLRTPEGELIKVFSLSAFCKDRGLNVKSLMNTIRLKIPIMKGSSAGWMIVATQSTINAVSV